MNKTRSKKSLRWRWAPARTSLLYRGWDRLGILTRGLIPRPFTLETLRYHRARDDAENDQHRPASNEIVEVYGVWAFEVFLPSNINAVAKTMRRRGWNAEARLGNERDLVGWLREMRDSGSRGYHNAYFTRPEDRRFTTIGHDAALPSFAQSASAKIICLTPSITCFTIFFIIKNSERLRFDTALRCNYRTTIEPIGRMISAITPDRARERAVNAVRASWRREIGQWFREHAPGSLSASKDDADLATCELLISDGVPLFEEPQEGRKHHHIAHLLQADYSPFVFVQSDNPEALFANGPRRSDRLAEHSILAIEKPKLETTVESLDSRSGESRFTYGVNEAFQNTFMQWSLLSLLQLQERTMNRARDRASKLLASLLPHITIRRLQRVTADLAETTMIIRELSDLADSGEFSTVEGYHLKLRKWRPSDAEPSIQDVIKGGIKRRTRRLRHANKELETFLSAQAALVSAYANLGLQIVVIVFAIFSLLLGGVSAYEAYRNLRSSPDISQNLGESNVR